MTEICNPDLEVGPGNKPRWNQPAHRRKGFHNAYRIFRRAVMLRARSHLLLTKVASPAFSEHQAVLELTQRPEFSAMALVKGDQLLFEKHADDFPATQPHSIQSISKIFSHLIAGRLIAEGRLDPSQPVETYLPEIGSGYRGALLSDVLDMNVANDFSEDYADPNADAYAEEAAIGWRLPPVGPQEPSLQEFVCSVTGPDVYNASPTIRYNSANTDLVTLICDRVAPDGVTPMLADIVDDMGIEGALHMSLSPESLPALSGGGCLTAVDLARFGLLLTRVAKGQSNVWSQPYMRRTLQGDHKSLPEPRAHIRYAGQLMTNGRWVGHTGYGGQVLMADTESGTVCAYLSVLENEAGYCVDYMASTMQLMQHVMDEIGKAA